MRKFIFILFAIVWVGLSTALSNNDDLDKTDINYGLGFLPDSVKSIIAENRSIIYSYGHHGQIWVVIYEKSDSLYILNGTTRQYQSMDKSEFDTTTFLNSNRPIIKWGLDSLILQSKAMIPRYRTQYSSLYRSLCVYEPKNQTFFDSNDAVAYSVTDSIAFKNKFHKLCLLMYWLSSSEIRPYVTEF